MHTGFRRLLGGLALIAAAAGPLWAGGWSVITLDDFPHYAVAGRPLTLTFTVRQHGSNLVSGLRPSVRALTPGVSPFVVHAAATARPGEYTATLRLDTPGDWSIVVDGGFNHEDRTRRYNAIALPTLRVIAAGPAPLVLVTEAERGAALLVTKGCVSCHAPGSDRDVTTHHLSADKVQRLLADPGALPADMPDLGLKPAEASALAAFIGRSGRAGRHAGR